MFKLARLSVLALAIVAPCSVGCIGESQEDEVTQGDEDELTSRGNAVATFKSDFTQSLSGSLAEGGKLRINYATSRLSQCRTTLAGGKPGWTITGFVSVNKSTPKTFYVAGHSADTRIDPNKPPMPEVAIDRAGEVAVWFQVTNVHGCSAFDSNYGKNYTFTAAPAPAASAARISFGADAASAPRASTTLAAPAKIEIDYAADRLPSCRGSLNGGAPAWTITGYASVNGEPAKSFYVAGYSADPSLVGKKPVLDVARAGKLSLWFQVTSRYGCSAWDSNLGKNYTFEVR